MNIGKYSKNGILILFCVASLTGGLWVYFQLRPMIAGDRTAAFTNILMEFVSAHDGRLPQDWSEFCNWMKVNKPGGECSVPELEKRFVILIHQRQAIGAAGSEIPHYIEIKDPAITGMTDFVNGRIQCTEFEKREQLKELHLTPAPASGPGNPNRRNPQP